MSPLYDYGLVESRRKVTVTFTGRQASAVLAAVDDAATDAKAEAPTTTRILQAAADRIMDAAR
jgi:hypothetical protein